MTELTRRAICQEIIALFHTDTGQLPVEILGLDWQLRCCEFSDSAGQITWTTTGPGQDAIFDEEAVEFLIISRLGVHRAVYHDRRKPHLRSVFDSEETIGLKCVSAGPGKLQLIPAKRRLFGNPTMEYDAAVWTFGALHDRILEALSIASTTPPTAANARPTPTLQPEPTPSPKPSPGAPAPTTAQPPQTPSAKRAAPVAEDHHSIMESVKAAFTHRNHDADDYYDEILDSVRHSIKRIRNRRNKVLCKDAYKKMVEAAQIVRQCDRKLKRSQARVAQLQKQQAGATCAERRDDLGRGIEVEQRLIAKEKRLREGKVAQFHGLREAIETIRTADERLSEDDVDILIDAALRSEVQDKDIKKAQDRLDQYL